MEDRKRILMISTHGYVAAYMRFQGDCTLEKVQQDE